jgi:PAB-dependent poly(A)-specific ribonuclease subunit 2
MSSRIAVLSSQGQVQVVDTAALTQPDLSMFQVSMPIEGCSTISMDISPSNQCVAFGDTTNSMHLYSSVGEPVLNPYARNTEFADQMETHPHMDISDPMAIYSSIPRPHLPEGQTAYASDYWPDRFNRPAYRPTPEVDPEILRTMKVVGTIGYARNATNMKRNQVRYPNVKNKETRDREAAENRDRDGGGGSVHPSIPKLYRKVAIKLGKMGLDEFDFDRYNRTGFCGIEASLPNSYCNAMLRILYFTEKLRMLMLNHTCTRENCICCELSFLFHMMDISPPGIPCQSGNFLRGMRTIPEASALGLIFPDQQSVWKSNVPRLIQSWNRFILHQIMVQSNSKEDPSSQSTGAKWGRPIPGGSPTKAASAAASEDKDSDDSGADSPFDASNNSSCDDPLFSQLFGLKQEKINSCSKCKLNVSTLDTILLCNLVYPDNARERTTFERIVCSSMCPEQTTPAWCDKCRRYQPTHQTRNLRSLPHALSLNAGMDNAQDIAFWKAQMEMLYEENKPEAPVGAAAAAKPVALPVAPPPNAKPCRYGQSCNRPDCKFWHPEQDGAATKEAPDVGDKLAKLNLSWVPMEVTINRHENGKVSYGDKLGGDHDGSPIEESKTYEL